MAVFSINTLSSLKGRGSGGHSSDEDDPSDQRQGFFVGGSERSGQEVLGPNRNDENIAERLFDAARRAGAEPLTAEEMERHQAGEPQGSRSGGIRLGTRNDTTMPNFAPRRESEVVVIRVIFWQNGFSVDDGPLREMSDPDSQVFLRSLQQGTVPLELVAKHRGKKVDLHMERRGTPYVKPKPKPFSGGGQRLGDVVPNVVTVSDDTSPAPKVELGTDEGKKLLEQAQEALNVNKAVPSGRIQIRPPSGDRMIGVFNETHTVEDVRTFIVTALPDFAFHPFQLYTVYPNVAITDESQTVKAAGILNAVVAIKLV